MRTGPQRGGCSDDPSTCLLSFDRRAGKTSDITESLTKRYSEEVGQVPGERERERGRERTKERGVGGAL